MGLQTTTGIKRQACYPPSTCRIYLFFDEDLILIFMRNDKRISPITIFRRGSKKEMQAIAMTRNSNLWQLRFPIDRERKMK